MTEEEKLKKKEYLRKYLREYNQRPYVKEKMKVKQKEYRLAHREKCNQYQNNYYWGEDKEKWLEYHRQYRARRKAEKEALFATNKFPQ